jgi:predicted N-acetyltransferase YhbS
MASMIIRNATEADDDEVGELLVRSFEAQNARLMPDVVTTPERRADLRNQKAKRAVATVLAGTIADRIVGTVTVYPPGAAGNEAWIPAAAQIRYLAVHVDYLGMNLSEQLLEEARAVATTLGATSICLHIRRGADGLGRMYERHGYRREPRGDIDILPVIFLEGYILPL